MTEGQHLYELARAIAKRQVAKRGNDAAPLCELARALAKRQVAKRGDDVQWPMEWAALSPASKATWECLWLRLAATGLPTGPERAGTYRKLGLYVTSSGDKTSKAAPR